jgi:hypothetical protein
VGANIFRNVLLVEDKSGHIKDARNHLEKRLATVLLYSKKEGAIASKSLVKMLRVGESEDAMKRNLKYLREVDTKTSPVSGIGMIDPKDSFGAKETIRDAMVEISRQQNFGNVATVRGADKMTPIPRFAIEMIPRPR